MKASVIVPVYNEEDAIERVIGDIKKVKHVKEIVVIDDGSSDMSYEIAKKMNGIKLVRHEKNQKKAAALETGFNNSSGDILVTIDADGTYHPKYIPVMMKIISDGNADMVIASRFIGKTSEMPRFNYIGNIFFSKMVSFLTSSKITDASSGMRALRKDVWKSVSNKSDGLEWEVEMTTRVLKAGYTVTEVPIEYLSRLGTTKLHPVKDGFRFFIGIIRGRFF